MDEVGENFPLDENVTIQNIIENYLSLYYPEDDDIGSQAQNILKKIGIELCKLFPSKDKKKVIEVEGRDFFIENFTKVISIVKEKYLFTGINVNDFLAHFEQEIKDDNSIIHRPDFEDQLKLVEYQKRGEKRKRDDQESMEETNIENDDEKELDMFNPDSYRSHGEKGTSGTSVSLVTTDMLGPELTPSITKDEFAKKEEDVGKLEFNVVENDGTLESLKNLLAVKNVFTNQLPKMPKDYCTRLVFDKKHRSLAGLKNGKIVAAITFRPFFENSFGEIAFLAVSGNEQVKGYGTRLMNHLKAYCVTVGIFRFLTYADNGAIGYFRKQGFSKDITLDEEKYKGYIKDYDGATLMECVLRPGIDYLNIPEMIKKQRARLYERINSTTNSELSNYNTTYKGLDFKKGRISYFKMKDVPGLTNVKPRLSDEEVSNLIPKLKRVYQHVKANDLSWPFQEPVNRKEVPDYYDVIKEPIDLQIIQKRIDKQFYRAKEIFIADFQRMFDNCRLYNKETTEYYQIANRLEQFFTDEMKKV